MRRRCTYWAELAYWTTCTVPEAGRPPDYSLGAAHEGRLRRRRVLVHLVLVGAGLSLPRPLRAFTHDRHTHTLSLSRHAPRPVQKKDSKGCCKSAHPQHAPSLSTSNVQVTTQSSLGSGWLLDFPCAPVNR